MLPFCKLRQAYVFSSLFCTIIIFYLSCIITLFCRIKHVIYQQYSLAFHTSYTCIFHSCYFSRPVQFPTRDDSVLDLILSRDPDLVVMFRCCIIWAIMITTWLVALFATNIKFLLTSELFVTTIKGIILLSGRCWVTLSEIICYLEILDLAGVVLNNYCLVLKLNSYR